MALYLYFSFKTDDSMLSMLTASVDGTFVHPFVVSAGHLPSQPNKVSILGCIFHQALKVVNEFQDDSQEQWLALQSKNKLDIAGSLHRGNIWDWKQQTCTETYEKYHVDLFG